MRDTNYIYLSTQRPISLGSYPKQNLVQLENFDDILMLPHADKRAYGYLEYSEPLSAKELAEYELQIYEPDIFQQDSVRLLNAEKAVECDLEFNGKNRSAPIVGHAMENQAILAALVFTLEDHTSDIYVCLRDDFHQEESCGVGFKLQNKEDFFHDFHAPENLRQTDYGINQKTGSLIIRKYDKLMPIDLGNSTLKDYKGHTLTVDFISVNRIPRKMKEQLLSEQEPLQIRENEYQVFHEKFNINANIMNPFIACIESVGVIEPDSIQLDLTQKDRER